jgi:HlyD family type I secretion membrane fusion protein
VSAVAPGIALADDGDHADVGRLVRQGWLLIGALVAACGVWTAAAPLTGAVIAPGHVKVDTNRKVVQHQEGGIVRGLRVREGQVVQAGEVLVDLADVQVDASLQVVRGRLDAETARRARLVAEREFASTVTFPDSLRNRRQERRVRELLDREVHLHRTRREMLDAQIRWLRTQIAETRSEIAVREEQIAVGREAEQLQRTELGWNADLEARGFVSRARVLGMTRDASEYRRRRGEHEADLTLARQRIADLELRIVNARNDYLARAAEEWKESTTQLHQLEESLRPAEDASRRQRIVAPVAGTVVDLAVSTVGAVIGPRDRLMDIVPATPDLIVEARIRPEDINSVHTGSPADVRLIAFRQRITPVVEGEVSHVSADRLVDAPTGQPYYVAHIRVTREALQQAGDLTLKAGMPAEVFVKTAARTPLDYLLDPVTAYLRRGMREP